VAGIIFSDIVLLTQHGICNV